jgi:hypothetical protein
LEVIRANKVSSLIKYVSKLKKLIPKGDPRLDGQESEDEGVGNEAIWPKMRKGQSKRTFKKEKEDKVLSHIVDASLPDNRREILTEEEKVEREERTKALTEEWTKIGRVQEELTSAQIDAIAREGWMDRYITFHLWVTVQEIQINFLLGTMPMDEKSDPKFLRGTEEIGFLTGSMFADARQSNVAGLANHYAPICT